MKVIHLKAENIKRLNAIDITPSTPLVVVAGNNEQGKSSTLDCIQMAMGGAKDLPEMPLKTGKARGSILLDLGDIVVKRRFSAKRSELVVENKDGEPQDSPQTLLDKLYGRLTFDPEEFKRMKPDVKSQTLRSIVGLDFSDLDAQREELYKRRTEVNRGVKSLKGTLDTIPYDSLADVPKEEVSVADLMREQANALRLNEDNHRKRSKYVETGKALQDLAVEISALNEKLQEKSSLMNLMSEKYAAMGEVLEGIKDADVGSINQRILDVSRINEKVKDRKERNRIQDQLLEREKESEVLTERIDAIDTDKAKRLANAKFPLPGLSFDESGLVTFEGIPAEQWSSSQALKISTHIGIALNPTLRVLLIRNGAAFDDKNLEVLRGIATENDMQIWIERVGYDEKASVIIEDGYSKGVER